MCSRLSISLLSRALHIFPLWEGVLDVCSRTAQINHVARVSNTRFPHLQNVYNDKAFKRLWRNPIKLSIESQKRVLLYMQRLDTCASFFSYLCLNKCVHSTVVRGSIAMWNVIMCIHSLCLCSWFVVRMRRIIQSFSLVILCPAPKKSYSDNFEYNKSGNLTRPLSHSRGGLQRCCRCCCRSWVFT